MRRLGSLVIAALALGSGLAGCSDDDSSPGDIAIDDLKRSLEDAYCAVYVRCGLVDDDATCRMLALGVDLPPGLVAAVKGGKVVYHPDEARACVDGLTARACDRTVVFSLRGVPDACDRIYEGLASVGESCALDQECISGHCAVPSCTDACCEGTCVGGTDPVRPHVGESCGSNPSCIDSYCDPDTVTCVPYLAAGESCTTAAQCADGMGCPSGACQPLAPTGSTCAVTGDCLEISATCSAATTTCTKVGLAGASCQTADDCADIYLCDATSHCKLRPRLGESCTDTGLTSCIDRTYCDPFTATCSTPQPDGLPCGSSDECASGYCSTGGTTVCTPAPLCI